MRKHILFACLVIFAFKCSTLLAQDKYIVTIDINRATEKYLPVNITLPQIKEQQAFFVIPAVVPGTYMKVNYERFYSHFRVWDKNGKTIPYRKKGKNVIEIKDARNAAGISYNVSPTTRDHRVWDNILACAGLIINPGKAYLLNAQLFCGYLEGYKNRPYEISIHKPDSLYIGTSLEAIQLQQSYRAPDYDELVDNPILITRPDTASFNLNNTAYNIVCYSDNGFITANKIQPQLLKTVTAVDSFFHHKIPAKNYTFLFYFQDYKKLKGFMKSFGLGSALEHRHGSSYYLDDIIDTTNFDKQIANTLNYIVPHEMAHLLMPLHIRSREVDDFNFKTPVMSQHIWMYEGFTDYFAKLICERSALPLYNTFRNNIATSMDVDKKRKKQILTISSKNCIKKNAFSFIGKILNLENMYARGAMVGLFTDIELFKLSRGTLRLEDVIQQLQAKYDVERPFDDAKILDEITAESYPEIGTLFSKYATSHERLPYDSLEQFFGWNIVPKGSIITTFGKLRVRFSTNRSRIIVRKKMNNTLGLHKGDILYKRGDSLLTVQNIYPLFYKPFFNSRPGDSISITVLRHGRETHLSTHKQLSKKLKYTYITDADNATQAQKNRYDAFIHHKEW